MQHIIYFLAGLFVKIFYSLSMHQSLPHTTSSFMLLSHSSLLYKPLTTFREA